MMIQATNLPAEVARVQVSTHLHHQLNQVDQMNLIIQAIHHHLHNYQIHQINQFLQIYLKRNSDLYKLLLKKIIPLNNEFHKNDKIFYKK